MGNVTVIKTSLMGPGIEIDFDDVQSVTALPNVDILHNKKELTALNIVKYFPLGISDYFFVGVFDGFKIPQVVKYCDKHYLLHRSILTDGEQDSKYKMVRVYEELTSRKERL